MSYEVLMHRAPYSSPNGGRKQTTSADIKNIAFNQESKQAGGGIYVSFDIFDPNYPKLGVNGIAFQIGDASYDDCSRLIRPRFNEAYARAKSTSSRPMPSLTEAEKNAIASKIGVAYRKWAGISHSAEQEDDDDVIDCTEESEDILEHREINTYQTPHPGFAGYSVNHEGYYSPNLTPTIDFRYQGCQLEEQQRTNPVVWFQFLSNKENFKPDGSGGVMTNCTLNFVSDPRMTKSNSLIKQMIAGKVKQWSDSRKIKYTLHETELNKCASGVHRLLMQYKQTHPEFVDHLNTSGNRKPSLSNVFGHSAYTVVPAGESELYHHGILGMKWGVRRYQNADGSLTAEGKKHYGNTSRENEANSLNKKVAIAKYGHDAYALQKEASKALKRGDKKLAAEYNELQTKNRNKQIQLRKDFADERVSQYGRKTAVAGELLKGLVRQYGISIAAVPLSAITGGVGALAGAPAGPVGMFVGYGLGSAIMSIPVSAISFQSGYVANRNISDIADSNRISKEKKYK